MTVPQTNSVYAQPMSVMRLPSAAFRLAASACVVMPIAAKTTAVIAIIRAIVTLSPHCLAGPASLEIKQTGSMLRNRSKLSLLRCPRTIQRLRFVGRMSALHGAFALGFELLPLPTKSESSRLISPMLQLHFSKQPKIDQILAALNSHACLLLPIHQNTVPAPIRTITASSTISAASSIQAIAGTKNAMMTPSMHTSHAGMCTPATKVPSASKRRWRGLLHQHSTCLARGVATGDSWQRRRRASAQPESRSGEILLFFRARIANRSKCKAPPSLVQETPNRPSSAVS